MRKILLAVLMLAASSAFADPPAGQGYTLVFSDEFSRQQPLDTSKWSTYNVCWGTRTFVGIGQQQIYVEPGFNGMTYNPHVPAE